MREILEVLDARNHPVGIVTKSALVTRDIDILARMAERGLAKVALSVTTLDRMLARTMEPRAATPTKRLEAIRQLSEAGIPTSVMVAPIVPGLTDQEIERILDAARAAGATRRRLCAASAAAGSQPDLQGLAAAPLSRPLPACDVAGALDARRQGLRFGMGQAHEGHRPLCLADRPPLRDRGAAARLQCAKRSRSGPICSWRPKRGTSNWSCFDRVRSAGHTIRRDEPLSSKESRPALPPAADGAFPDRRPNRPGRTCGELEPMRASPQHGSPAFRFSAPLRVRRKAGLLRRTEGDRRRAVAGRGPRRGRPRTARRAGRGGCRHPRSEAHSQEVSTIRSGFRRSQREALFPVILRKALGVSVASVCAEGIDRSDIRKASLEAMRRALAGLPVTARHGARRRTRRAARPDLRLPGAGPGRPALAVDRRRVDRRQGHARPHDAGLRPGRPALRAGGAYGLRDRAPPRGDRGPRTGAAAAPPVVFAVQARRRSRWMCRKSSRPNCFFRISATKKPPDLPGGLAIVARAAAQLSLDFTSCSDELNSSAPVLASTFSASSLRAASTAMSTALARTSLTASRSACAIFCSASAVRRVT